MKYIQCNSLHKSDTLYKAYKPYFQHTSYSDMSECSFLGVTQNSSYKLCTHPVTYKPHIQIYTRRMICFQH